MPAGTESSTSRYLLLAVRALALLVPSVALILGGEWFFHGSSLQFAVPHALYPHVTVRHFAFRTLVEVMLGLWLVLAAVDPRFRPRWSPIAVAIAVFLAVMALADALGVNPTRSFWSNFERMEGFVTLAHLFAFFLVVSSVFNSERYWKWFFVVCLGVCFLVCLDAASQFNNAMLKKTGDFKGAPFLQPVPAWAMGRAYVRVDARLASPVYLGVHMIFHAFLAMFLLLRARTTLPRCLYGGMVVLCLLTLFLTGTRIAYFGMMVGVAVAVATIAFGSQEPVWRRWARIATGAMAVVGALVVALLWIDPAFLKDLPVLSRLVGEEVESSSLVRLALWKMVWHAFLEHPLLGWGQENFAYVFAAYFDPAVFGKDIQPWWDRPHNVVLSWLCDGGLLGMTSYLGLFAAAGYVLWKRTSLSVPERALLTGMLVGYFVFNGGQLDNLLSYLMFFSVLAYLHMHAVRGQVDPDGAAPGRVGAARPAVAVVFAALVIGGGAMMNSAMFTSAAAVTEMTGHLRGKNGPGGLKSAKSSLELGWIDPSEVRETIANTTKTMLGANRQPVPIKRAFYEMSTTELGQVVEDDPRNMKALSVLGELLNEGGEYDRAAAVLEQALEVSPNRQYLCFQLGLAYYWLKRMDDAAVLYRRGFELSPDSGLGRLTSAQGAMLVGDRELEDEVLGLMRRDQQGPVFLAPFRLFDTLRFLRNGERMIELLEPVAADWRQRRRPGKPLSRVMKKRLFALKDGYLLNMQPGKAKALLREMIQFDPKFAEQGRKEIARINSGGPGKRQGR